MAEEQYFNRDEAAAYLRVPRSFIDRLIKYHEIAVVRMGYRTVRLRRSDLDAWAAENVELPQP